MNTQLPDDSSPQELADPVGSIAEYLRRHREFFVDYPELLADLVIPHASGKAVSLVEKQVEVLREENRQLKTRFRELVAIARDNEDLARRMHRLTLRLVESSGPAATFAVLDEGLRADFAADFVALRILAEPAPGHDGRPPEFIGPDPLLKTLFAEALDRRQPICGRLKRNQQEALFGGDADAVGSVAVLPLLGRHWQGLLAIGSRDPRRYHAEMGIDLLAHLGDIASLIIDPWVAVPGGPVRPA
jgi:uncharacterized protein YigA (DUF484 family)